MLPDNVPSEFLRDVTAFTIMFHSGTVACSNRGVDHQKEMQAKYPKEWMNWVFDTVGVFTEDGW